jgi:hypothetical protein
MSRILRPAQVGADNPAKVMMVLLRRATKVRIVIHAGNHDCKPPWFGAQVIVAL